MNSIAAIEQTAGPAAARAARRSLERSGSKSKGASRRPGWVTYTILTVVLLVSAFPLYFAVLLASSAAWSAPTSGSGRHCGTRPWSP